MNRIKTILLIVLSLILALLFIQAKSEITGSEVIVKG